MTISKLVKILFNELFPVNITYIPRAVPVPRDESAPPPIFKSGRAKRQDEPKTNTDFNTEEMMHYLMLSGMLHDDEVRNDVFTIQDEKSKKTWTLKYLIMWCSLQIKFCKWNINRTEGPIRHHRTYIDHGIMDFYMSLWFYALHCLKYVQNDRTVDLKSVKKENETDITFEQWLKEDNDTLAQNMQNFTATQPLEFEEFHYYYTSVLPFFIKRYYIPAYTCSNLSDMVFSLIDHTDGTSANNCFDLEGLRNPAILIIAVKKNISVIYKAVFFAWDVYVLDVSAMIHADMPDVGLNENQTFIKLFFTKPSRIFGKRAQTQSGAAAAALDRVRRLGVQHASNLVKAVSIQVMAPGARAVKAAAASIETAAQQKCWHGVGMYERLYSDQCVVVGQVKLNDWPSEQHEHSILC